MKVYFATELWKFDTVGDNGLKFLEMHFRLRRNLHSQGTSSRLAGGWDPWKKTLYTLSSQGPGGLLLGDTPSSQFFDD